MDMKVHSCQCTPENGNCVTVAVGLFRSGDSHEHLVTFKFSPTDCLGLSQRPASLKYGKA